MEIARRQHAAGRYFVYEHPLGASSWKLASVARVAAMPGVTTTVVDMCAYGLASKDEKGDGLVKKPTQLLTNMPAVAGGMARILHLGSLGGGGGRGTEEDGHKLAADAEMLLAPLEALLAALILWVVKR